MIITKNKKAFFNYYIKETYEAGIVLKGWEVKSIRLGMTQIKESYIKIYKNEFFIINLYINNFKNFSKFNKINTNRTKKILLKKIEIKKLIGKINKNRYTMILLDLHYNKSLIKAKIGLVKGKKQYNKKEIQKKKDLIKYNEYKIKNKY
ncbi:SsrA-binding protein SmpB [Candidatus Zinderia endosymbiont of Aphrophora alni]|uniref:SsrA-binding protein SmpB n=1 Tax=Candidatus Zinderia endosymbiont of Aphrophora alni TaxID=3077951 RepID=UPI0030D3B501